MVLGPALKNLSLVRRLEGEYKSFIADAIGRATNLKSKYINSISAPQFTFFFSPSTLLGEVLCLFTNSFICKMSIIRVVLATSPWCIQLQRRHHWACSEDVGYKYHHQVTLYVMNKKGTCMLVVVASFLKVTPSCPEFCSWCQHPR